jgi:2-phosphosulfolactate phosphatase
MSPHLDAILSPLELESMKRRSLDGTICVVFDILRATTSMVTALAQGAASIRPVSEIKEAVAWKREHPDVILAGERDGLRIRADLADGVEFDLGNSPREFTRATVEGKTIVMTTTNGTRALQACRNAQRVLVASFLNLRATAHWIKEHQPDRLLLVCSGTEDQPALEDVLAAGALCEKIWALYSHGQISDAAEMARRIFPLMQSNLAEAMKSCRNGRRLLGMPDLQDDVLYCVQRETVDIVACMDRDGVVKILS